MFHTGTDQGLMFQAIKDSKPFLFVDGKADSAMTGQIRETLRRGELAHAEMRRRSVRFLPKQVLKPIWAAVGLKPGNFATSRGSDFLRLDSPELAKPDSP